MKLKNKITIFILILLVFIGTALIPDNHAGSYKKEPEIIQENEFYQPIKEYLTSRGLPGSFLDTLFSDRRIEFYPDILFDKQKMPSFKTSRPGNNVSKFHKYNLHQFTSEYSEYFEKAWEKYRVDKESICAVLYVETRFGRNTGNYSTLNVLISLAMADQEFALEDIEEYVEQNYHYMPHRKRNYIKQYYLNYARRKAERARRELAILLRLYRQNKVDAKNLAGSYAGAFGYPQFLPSSYEKYAVDGDNNGTVDLFTFPDAILSVGNFLKNHGWSHHLYAQKQALRRYNNSERYVADVLNIARYFDQQPQ
jgi:membrane-bound lytic murein transglycosylase B